LLGSFTAGTRFAYGVGQVSVELLFVLSGVRPDLIGTRGRTEPLFRRGRLVKIDHVTRIHTVADALSEEEASHLVSH
jgi:hypothetical protein